MMYSGIDLHSNNSVVAVIDDADRVVAHKRLANEITKIVGFLARWKDELAGVVVESTYNWYWLVDGLQDAGLRVHLANTAAIKQYDGLKHSGDETDARHLAHLLRLGIVWEAARRRSRLPDHNKKPVYFVIDDIRPPARRSNKGRRRKDRAHQLRDQIRQPDRRGA